MRTLTLAQRIGGFVKEVRERKQNEQRFIDVLREAGYKDSTFQTMDDKDLDIYGRHNQYKETFEFGVPFTNYSDGIYALVPVHHVDRYSGHESDKLVLVDSKNKRVLTVVHPGDRGVHYNGRCRIIPTAMNIVDNKRAIVSYKFVLHADLKDPIKVSESIWEDHLFRYTENCVTEVDLSKMEARK